MNKVKYQLLISSTDTYKSLFLAYILLFFFGWFGAHKIYTFWDTEVVTWELYLFISTFSIVSYLIWVTFTNAMFSGMPLVILGCSIFALSLLLIFLISDAISMPSIIKNYNSIIKNKKQGSFDFNNNLLNVLTPTKI